ncbi:MAG: ABCB family ABC transporter ATP-binding protein/permease [Geminicoccaceae bacterium]
MALNTPKVGLAHALKDLLPYLWPRDARAIRVRVVAALALLITAKLINVQVPFFFKDIVDRLSLEPSALSLPLFALLAYGIARLTASVFSELRDAVFARVSQRAGRLLALRVFRHLFALSLRYHLERRTGELSRAIDRGVNATTFMLGMVLFNIVPTLFEFSLVIGILLVRYEWWFAAITFVTIVGYGVFTVSATEWRIRFRRIMNQRENDASARAVDGLINYETVKTFTNEGFEVDRLNTSLHAYEDAAVASRVSLSALNAGQMAIVAIGVTALMAAAAQGVVAGTMTVGDVVLVNTFLLQLYQPLNLLGFVYREVKQAITDLENISGLLTIRPEIEDAPDAKPLQLEGGSLRFAAVRFAYDARREVLHDIDFEVPSGATVAVVGPSGAGKSTLTRLLFRFYDVSGGAITVDGQDIRDLTQASLREAIGVVPQDTVLFNESIRANIAYGRPDARVEEIVAAARLAQIDAFIQGLPDGYDTLVGERGLKLSGGEKQRVAIARMAMKDPPILILDEATSALDTATEQAIQEALQRLSAGRTTLGIAHRLSTVIEADRILVMEAGRIVESGSHKALLADNGIYAAMWRRQMQGHGSEQCPAEVAAG